MRQDVCICDIVCTDTHDDGVVLGKQVNRADCPLWIFLYTKHHRKPTSIGGTDDERNISFIMDYLHKAWHQVVRNYSAPRIARILTNSEIFPGKQIVAVPRWWGINSISQKDAEQLERFVSYSSMGVLSTAQRNAWEKLFEHRKDWDDKSRIEYINNTYLDPDFILMFTHN